MDALALVEGADPEADATVRGHFGEVVAALLAVEVPLEHPVAARDVGALRCPGARGRGLDRAGLDALLADLAELDDTQVHTLLRRTQRQIREHLAEAHPGAIGVGDGEPHPRGLAQPRVHRQGNVQGRVIQAGNRLVPQRADELGHRAHQGGHLGVVLVGLRRHDDGGRGPEHLVVHRETHDDHLVAALRDLDGGVLVPARKVMVGVHPPLIQFGEAHEVRAHEASHFFHGPPGLDRVGCIEGASVGGNGSVVLGVEVLPDGETRVGAVDGGPEGGDDRGGGDIEGPVAAGEARNASFERIPDGAPLPPEAGLQGRVPDDSHETVVLLIESLVVREHLIVHRHVNPPCADAGKGSPPNMGEQQDLFWDILLLFFRPENRLWKVNS